MPWPETPTIAPPEKPAQAPGLVGVSSSQQTQIVQPNETFTMMWTLDLPHSAAAAAACDSMAEPNMSLRNVAGYKLEPFDDAVLLQGPMLVAHCTFCAPSAVGMCFQTHTHFVVVTDRLFWGCFCRHILEQIPRVRRRRQSDRKSTRLNSSK